MFKLSTNDFWENIRQTWCKRSGFDKMDIIQWATGKSRITQVLVNLNWNAQWLSKFLIWRVYIYTYFSTIMYTARILYKCKSSTKPCAIITITNSSCRVRRLFQKQWKKSESFYIKKTMQLNSHITFLVRYNNISFFGFRSKYTNILGILSCVLPEFLKIYNKGGVMINQIV